MDASTFRFRACFAIDVLPALTARADQADNLRQTILNLAVRGKLVKQCPADEPASELVKRITSEKSRLMKAVQIGKQTRTPSINESDAPFEVPRAWAWLRLQDIGSITGGMTPLRSNAEYWNGNIIWLSPKDIRGDELFDSKQKITLKGLSDTRLQLYQAGCLFMVARSGILKRTFPVAINRVPATSNQDLKVLTPFLEGQERYLQIMFRGLTDYILKNLVKTGTTVQSLNTQNLLPSPFPIPPLLEQQRIVAKVDELMGLCDRLEAALSTFDVAQGQLLKATLQEALREVA